MNALLEQTDTADRGNWARLAAQFRGPSGVDTGMDLENERPTRGWSGDNRSDHEGEDRG